MNIHEYQAKELLKEFSAPVPKGVVIYDIKEVAQKTKTLGTNNLVVKAQIHAGGRGKAGGIKLVKPDLKVKKLKDYTLKKLLKYRKSFIYLAWWTEQVQK